MTTVLRLTALCVALFACDVLQAGRPNVLFIAVDDLRVELGCYGNAHVKSPHIDRLAKRGVLFERAYCQQTVCNPSRASVLTGMRPDTLRVWDLRTHFRQHKPNAVTLPQLFMKSGYHAQDVGKIFHNWRQDDWRGDPASWSVPAVLHYNTHGRDKPQISGPLPPNLASGKFGAECRDVPDSAYYDGRVADSAIVALRQLKEREVPFFLGVGFWKPHLPFNAPKKYWDLYEREAVPVPSDLTSPAGVPEIALTPDRLPEGEEAGWLREQHHGHLAAISYLDAQVGRVLGALDELDLSRDTIVVFWSDHGLHIGEHGLRRKTTVFELDARVPLIIASPEHGTGQRTSALVELLDLYPTLAELCGLETPRDVEGVSLVPLLRDSSRTVKNVALTQTPRPNYLRGKRAEVMGYSIRAARYRYTEWRELNSGHVLARELYDHQEDPLETANIAGKSEHAAAVADLAEELTRVLATSAATPDPVASPQSPLLLDLSTTGRDPTRIEFDRLPQMPSNHAMISDVRDRRGTRVHQHAYLAHFDGRYWAMWSDGPGVPRRGAPDEHRNSVPGHDQPGTRVSYATSGDGLHWSEPQDLSGPPRIEGFGWIARGLWVRDGELLALASHFNAPGYPGKGLSLEAFRWAGPSGWQAHGTVLDDTLNNFPPKKLPSGEYLMTRRDHLRELSVIVGGQQGFNDWRALPLTSYVSGSARPEEPYWYVLPDGRNLVGLIRDNAGSKRLLRTFSTDNGRTWSPIVRTNFPDARSKFFVLRTSRGYYVMVSNARPAGRDPLTLAVSPDGLVFRHLFYLVGGRHVDYPHMIEEDGHLLISFSGAKQTVEVLRVALDDVDRLVGQ